MSSGTTRVESGGVASATVDNTTGEEHEKSSSADGGRQRRRWPGWSWQGVLATVTAFTGASAVLLHLIGNAVHITYFSEWGIDSGAFPKSPDWLVIMGYYGVWSALVTATVEMLKNWPLIILGGAGSALYLFILVGPWNPTNSIINWLVSMPGVPKWIRKSLFVPAIGMWVAIASLSIVLMLSLLIGIPSQIGSSIGKEAVEDEIKDFARGCAASKRKCIRLLRDETLVGEGYLLESSQSHIAFLDVSLQKVRVVLREKLELQVMRLPLAQE